MDTKNNAAGVPDKELDAANAKCNGCWGECGKCALDELRESRAPASAKPVAPEGFALVPLVPNRAMRQVMDEEGWHWEDLLAAAGAITEEQYGEIQFKDRAPVAPVAEALTIEKWQDRYANLGKAPNDLTAERRKGACRDAEISDLRAALARQPGAEVPENFVEWVNREMPAGTVIGDPAWWASKIARALAQHSTKEVPSIDTPDAEWGRDLQLRLMAASQDLTESDDARQVMAEAACCLAALTGRPDQSQAAATAASSKGEA